MKAVARKTKPAPQPSTRPKKSSAWICAGATVLHRRTRNRYFIEAIALDKTHNTKVVVYRSCVGDGMTYVRVLHEFSVKFVADAQLSIELN
jgi:hypothetical protein